nr:MAG: hypothetical protein [Caudoviricetes sp.]
MDIYDILKTKKHNPHYLNRYIRFISSRNSRMLNPTDVTEIHHILPKAKEMFPEYKKLRKFKWNAIKLTLREHYIAHLLLYKTFNNQSTILALKFMIDYHISYDENIKKSKLYEKLRSEFYHISKNREIKGQEIVVDGIKYTSITKYIKSGNSPIGMVALLTYLKEYSIYFPTEKEGIYISSNFLEIKKLRESNKIHTKTIIVDDIIYQSKKDYFKKFQNKPYTIPQLNKFIKDYSKHFPEDEKIYSYKFELIADIRKKKYSESKKGENNSFYGKSHSKKTKQKNFQQRLFF